VFLEVGGGGAGFLREVGAGGGAFLGGGAVIYN